MDKKEFNIIINDIGEKLNPLNQLLYQSLILIVFYYFFYNIKQLELHKSFIILFSIICIILDLCIWNNINQTILFGAILIIYITYNINKEKSMANFINVMNDLNDNKNDNIKELWEKEEIERKNKNEIEKITFVPKNIYDNKDNTKNLNYNTIPEPYDKENSDINEIRLAYKSDIPIVHITDSQYANIMLNELYDTSQYKNIKKDSIDKALDSDIHFTTDNDIVNKNNNIELFRKPKIQFLETQWLSNKDNTYNDTCKMNKCIGTHTPITNNTNNNTNNNTTTNTNNKNAICYVSNFGKILSECTNQNNTISDTQLDKISTNKINDNEFNDDENDDNDNDDNDDNDELN